MKALAIIVAVALGLLGLLFLIGAGQGNAVVRVSIGVVCLLAAVALLVLARMKPATTTHVHEMKVDLTGDVKLENMVCRQCGAPLSSESVSYKAGAIYVACAYCGSTYQIEEAPKW